MTHRNHALAAALCLTLLCVGVLTGCGPKQEAVSSSGSTSAPAAASSQPPAESAQPELPDPTEVLAVSGPEAIQEELTQAICQLRQPRPMDISAARLEQPELDVKNLYYRITAQDPGLKYAYDLTAEVRDAQLICSLHYMPYKTGAFPEGFDGVEVSSLKDLISAAEAHMGPDPAPVRITDTALDPDTMNRALQQVGGGYLYCTLSPDATEVRYSAPMDRTVEDCLDALNHASELADQVIAQVVTPDMTQRERAQALYAYVTTNVAYDQRYYSDKAGMPYESQTALGALRDKTAICGGYANAVKLLFEKAGIPCYNVTGRYFGEHHMWSIAKLDGEWLWFDATSDRGSTGEFGFLRFALTELDPTKYRWNENEVSPLLD